MNGRETEAPGVAAPRAEECDSPEKTNAAKDSTSRPWRVELRGARMTTFGRYATRAQAEQLVGQLRRQGFDAHLEHDEEPEFGNDRRRFLVAMVMGGCVSHRRIVERVLADVDDEQKRTATA